MIGPAIDAFLADESWRYEHDRRDVRHIKEMGEHVDIRANGALAVAMRMFDLAAGEQVYTDTDHYRYLAGWMDAMRDADGSCYGCRDVEHGPAVLPGLAAPLHPALVDARRFLRLTA